MCPNYKSTSPSGFAIIVMASGANHQTDVKRLANVTAAIISSALPKVHDLVSERKVLHVLFVNVQAMVEEKEERWVSERNQLSFNVAHATAS
ncbi:hypothetical protein BOTNAR_0055g00290 [Botryotinia narcissicola]|uniref:Uncharacterized protein n=1 Tax=Botryotinia narcissicola TaxID=278944 RepID=A0A4Z1J5A4_9HELO|nr:hypothetical protein BOTNAR_0055g00290 [Botryotinia narcissicola]